MFLELQFPHQHTPNILNIKQMQMGLNKNLFQISQQALNITQWKLLGEGMEHIVLQYVGPNHDLKNKAIVINKEDYLTQYNLPKMKSLNQQLIKFHLILISYLPIIQKHQLKYQNLLIQQDKKQNFLAEIKDLLKVSKRIRVENDTIQTKKNIRICDNLFNPRIIKGVEQTVIIQFKPKCILLSKYPIEIIRKVSQNINVPTQTIIQKLNTGSPEQKSKWYKNKFTKNNRSINKLSPFDIFSYSAKKYLDDSTRSVVFINGQSADLSAIKNKDLYDEIINEALKRSKILQEILNLHLLFDKSLLTFRSFNMQDIQNLLTNLKFQQAHACILQSLQVIKNLNIQDKISSKVIQGQQYSENIEIDLLRMLISTTWRDVSLIIQVNLLKQHPGMVPEGYDILKIDDSLASVKITIVDYNCKPVSRIDNSQKKQFLLLQKFLKMTFNQK